MLFCHSTFEAIQLHLHVAILNKKEIFLFSFEKECAADEFIELDLNTFHPRID